MTAKASNTEDHSALTRESRFEELQRYAAFTTADSGHLQRALPRVAPHFPAVVEAFYDRLSRHEGATRVFADLGQVERLKQTLLDWLDSFFRGPHDEVYHQIRSRIGRVHVVIGLELRYMVLAMGLVREHLTSLLDAADPARTSVGRLCDIELAIMVETFSAEFTAVLKRRERLAAVGQITASISHEVKNPLGVIASSVYALRSHCDRLEREASARLSEPVKRHLDRIQRNVEQAGGIVTTLLEFMRHREPQRVRAAWGPAIQEAVQQVELPSRLRLRVVVEDGAGEAWFDRAQLARVVANLVRNAAEAMGAVDTAGDDDAERGEAGLLEVVAGGDAERVWACVRDRGPGIAPAAMAYLFEPLRTTKEVGTGLGLALCRAIIEAHDGHIRAHNRPDGGAEVRFELPRAQPGAA